ncbi:MAG: trypsin-like peptidase domain-containing protein [Deltaproteobacteria bacterium]|nr:MAG: trypsin-like peptidase domain-containing protein [Deltaproteobacteria bacterium]
MKHTNILVIVIFIIGSMISNNTCSSRPISSRETPIVRVVKEYAPAVVNIRTEKIVDLKKSREWGLYGGVLDSFFQEYLGGPYSEGTLRYKSIGSGVIIDKSGLVVTNAHVIQRASHIYVVLKDGTMLQAEVMGMNQNDDLAIIKTDLPYPVKEAKFADINDVMIGETVIAIGNPLGLENSVSVGVLSGKDRAFLSTQCTYVCSGLLQTDAPINPGNSGGALLNLDGELIGVNLAVVQSAQNIGFAVPVDKIVKLLKIYK